MDLQQTLEQVFSTNFECYYRAHVSHVNVTGRNFFSDHLLLGKIYEDLQDNIDTLAELLRTIKAQMPQDLGSVIGLAATADNSATGDADDLLQIVYDDQEVLIDEYKALMIVAEEEGNFDIANFAQDRLKVHNKFCWQIRATLENNIESDDDSIKVTNHAY